MKISAFDTRKQIDRIHGMGYTIPSGTTVDRLAAGWLDMMEGLERHELELAVTGYLRDGSTYWPKPGQIRQRAIAIRGEDPKVGRTDLRSRYLAWESTHEGPCPVCNATVRLLTAEERGVHNGGAGAKRFGVYHDHRAHRLEKVPWVGYPILQDDGERRNQKRIGPGSAA